ncbi:uncharacterized protein TNCV_2504361 [Trichonephila clavipes]|uniref:Uncharacterized protein n=1 Tax=Trichonephila clavipes TaxID=2585209 RepID=A0A8X6WFK9_TRICX|nr:uncharacterized protein TNCV_2504361 [Trichonephila clavipes]
MYKKVFRDEVINLFIYLTHENNNKRALSPNQYYGYKLWAIVCGSGCGSLVVKVLDYGWRVMSSSPVSLKTRRVEQRCTLNLSRAQTSSLWCDLVVRRGGCQLKCRPRHLTMVQNYEVHRQKPLCS